MNVDKLIESLPTMSASERKIVRERAESWLRHGTPEQQAAAQRVTDALNQLHVAEAQTRSRHVEGLPKPERIIEAFRAIPMTETDRKAIQSLLDNPGATSARLSEAAGWKNMSWHMHFGAMCADRGAYLWPAAFVEKRNADFYSGILADYSDDTHGFTMKPEAVEAFAILGLKGSAVS